MQPTSIDVEVFIESLLQPPDKLAVLYPGCSLDSSVVVDLADSSLFNVTMVTYAFSSLITDSLNFPHHFRMVPSETNQMNGIVAFIGHFGWQRVIGIAEEQPVYISLADATASLAKESGVGIELILLRNIDDTADILRLALVSMCMQSPFTFDY